MRSGVKMGLMKKLLAILVLGLLWCNVGFADDQAKRKALIDKINLIISKKGFNKVAKN